MNAGLNASLGTSNRKNCYNVPKSRLSFNKLNFNLFSKMLPTLRPFIWISHVNFLDLHTYIHIIGQYNPSDLITTCLLTPLMLCVLILLRIIMAKSTV